jgi:hypothetical protein
VRSRTRRCQQQQRSQPDGQQAGPARFHHSPLS